MTFALYLQKQARTCLRLSEAIADRHLADRTKAMAEDLLQRAREADEEHDGRLAAVPIYTM